MNNPARFRNLISFEERGEIQNDAGHWVADWVDSKLGTTHAQIRTIRGKEFIQAGAKQADVSARINIRYRKDVEDKYFQLDGKLRFKFGDRIFEIVYMNNLEERNIELEFIVNEVQ